MTKRGTPRIPKIDEATIKDILAKMPEFLKQQEQDDEDRRNKRGKYALPTGICVVCKGTVKAQIAYPNSDIIGVPPLSGYVDHWECESCGLMYGRPPQLNKPKEMGTP